MANKLNTRGDVQTFVREAIASLITAARTSAEDKQSVDVKVADVLLVQLQFQLGRLDIEPDSYTTALKAARTIRDIIYRSGAARAVYTDFDRPPE